MSQQAGISYSSVETQRQIRIEKMYKLEDLGQNPFTPYSKKRLYLI